MLVGRYDPPEPARGRDSRSRRRRLGGHAHVRVHLRQLRPARARVPTTRAVAARRPRPSARTATPGRRGPRSPGRRGAAELGASIQFAEAVREAAEADAARRLDRARRRPQVLARQMLRLERRHAESAALAHAMLREPASRDGAMALLHPASPQVRARRSPSTSSKTTRSPRARRGSRGQRHPRGIPGRMGEGAP